MPCIPRGAQSSTTWPESHAVRNLATIVGRQTSHSIHTETLNNPPVLRAKQAPMSAPLRQAPHSPHVSAPPAPRQKEPWRRPAGNFFLLPGLTSARYLAFVSRTCTNLVCTHASANTHTHTHTHKHTPAKHPERYVDACSASGWRWSPAIPRVERPNDSACRGPWASQRRKAAPLV